MEKRLEPKYSSFIIVFLLTFTMFNMAGSKTLAKDTPSEFLKGNEVSIKVLSYNIHHGTGGDGVFDLKRTGDVLAESDADIIGIQEIDKHWSSRSEFKDQTKWLAEYLGMHYTFGANLDRDPLEEGEQRRQYGTAVLSKYPIIDHENQLLTSSDREQRGLLKTTINIKGNHLHFFNTHLGLSSEERQVQAAEIMEIANEKKGPLIIVGDLNAAPDTDEIETISAKFNDSFAEQNNDYTFPSDDPYIRADYIFYSAELKNKKAEVIHTSVSDHLPIIAEFMLKRQVPYPNGKENQ